MRILITMLFYLCFSFLSHSQIPDFNAFNKQVLQASKDHCVEFPDSLSFKVNLYVGWRGDTQEVYGYIRKVEKGDGSNELVVVFLDNELLEYKNEEVYHYSRYDYPNDDSTKSYLFTSDYFYTFSYFKHLEVDTVADTIKTEMAHYISGYIDSISWNELQYPILKFSRETNQLVGEIYKDDLPKLYAKKDEFAEIIDDFDLLDYD